MSMAADEIIPFRFFDDQRFLRATVADVVLRFDDCLSPQKLRKSFERLLSLGKWRQLGARIRLDARGKLEYHLPEQYDEKRPAFAYTCVEQDQNIGDHPVASQIPYAKAAPHVCEMPEDLVDAVCDGHYPRYIEDWLNEDRPAISMVIIVFWDATVVTLTFPHVVADGIGIANICQAWIAVLDGRESDVPPFVGLEEDPLGCLVEHVPSSATCGSRAPSVAPVEEGRIVQIPGRCIRKLKEQATQDLHQQTGDGNLFVSDSDVLSAWWARTHASVLDLSSGQAVTLLNLVNYRGIIDDILPHDKAFVGNATAVCSTHLISEQLLERPIWQVASRLRASLTNLTTKEGIRSIIANQKRHGTPTGEPPSNNGLTMILTNWNKAGYFKMDFGAAAVRHGPSAETRGARPVYASFLGVVPHYKQTALGHRCIVMGKDGSENWWLAWWIRKELWPALERKISEVANA